MNVVTPFLFRSFTLKSVTLRNRIVASPMCQYSATDGVVNDWHRVHLQSLARGGAGMVIVEATAVSSEGRITSGCAGLWNEVQMNAFKPVAAAMKAAGAIPGIQIAHAGRKASANLPWEGNDHMEETDPRSWEPIAPSAIPFGGNLPRVPRAMTLGDIGRVKSDFVNATVLAHEAGFEWLMLHFAHGYLAQSFLSSHSNHRKDRYGGTFENRARFLVETVEAVRAVWPLDKPLSIRLGVIEFDGRDEETLVESIELIRRFKEVGIDFIDVSLGGSAPDRSIPWGPGFLAPYARRIRKEVGLPGSTTWNLGTPELAEAMVRDGDVDVVMIGRPLLANPHWPYSAAVALGFKQAARLLPVPYAHWLTNN